MSEIVTLTGPVNVPFAGAVTSVVNVGVAAGVVGGIVPLDELLDDELLLDELLLLDDELEVLLAPPSFTPPVLDVELVLLPPELVVTVLSSSPPQATPSMAPPTTSAARLTPRKL